MADKFMEQAEILRQEKIAEDIFSLWIATEHIAEWARAGQFLSVYCDESSRLLPRPLSICEIDPRSSTVRMVYRVAGEGTREFSEKQTGETLRVLGPLGNGFPMKKEKALLIGGGIGIPPILELAKQYKGEKQIVLGYRDNETFLADDFAKQGEVFFATEDGSVGTQGTVIDAVREENLSAEILYACGPAPMLRALKEYAAEHEMECWISMEERMACGIGACLSCVCQTTDVDAHTNVMNRRVCRDGPVFNAREVEL